MLKGKQIRYLRRLSHHVKPVMQIGKNGITENFLHTFFDAINAHELVKVSVLDNCLEDKTDLANIICENVGCELVQIIGNQLIFYRPSNKENNKRIILPQ
ncbi:MAG TPA: ribosome assembly RNA-binding protein YhbY [Haloplasmataceae bacterium]